MYQIDYEVFDKLLVILFEKDGTEPVYVAETVGWIMGKEVHRSKEFFQIYPKYMAELREHGLARERLGSGTIMDITPFGRQVAKVGGWRKYSQLRQENAQEEQRKQNYKDQLDLEKTQRELEKLKYEASIRNLDERVKQLTAINLALQNSEIIYRWAAAIGGVIAGVSLKPLAEYFGILQWLIRHLAR